MPTVKLSPILNDQVTDEIGAPAVGWKIYTYTAGSSTPQETYTSSAGDVPQPNPIVLDALGFPALGPIWLASGVLYKMVLTDENDVVKKTFDNIAGTNDSTATISQWIASGVPSTYISGTSFSVPGDQTSEFHIGRREQFFTGAGTLYGAIINSVYNGTTLTTVTVQMDSGALDNGLTAVNHSILRADNIATPTNVATTAQVGGRQDIMVLSGGNLVLQPFNGNRIWVNGALRKIPSAGVSLPPTGLTPGTIYYIYTADSNNDGIVDVLEASTTGHTTDATSGQEVKIGDTSRTVVGMVRPVTGPAFQSGGGQMFVLSYANRRRKTGLSLLTSNASATSSSFVELTSTFRFEFLTWVNSNVRVVLQPEGYGNLAGSYFAVSVGIDGSSPASAVSTMKNQAANSGTLGSVTYESSGLAEGYHYASAIGHNAGAGNAISLLGNGSVGTSSSFQGTIEG